MSDYRITLTKRAEEDIIDIGDYITYTFVAMQWMGKSTFPALL